jgi:hypothetical protein
MVLRGDKMTTRIDKAFAELCDYVIEQIEDKTILSRLLANLEDEIDKGCPDCNAKRLEELTKRLLERKKKRIKTTEQRIEEFDGDLSDYEFEEWDTGKPVGKEVW